MQIDVTSINKLLDVLSAKWTTEIMREVNIGPVRTRKFLARIPGLTMKCLRQRLIALEELGYVHRQEFDERPMRVEYSITDKGRKVYELLMVIKQYADDLNRLDCGPRADVIVFPATPDVQAEA